MKRLLVIFLYLTTSFMSYAQSEVTINVWVHGTYPVLNVLAHKYSPFRSWVYTKPGLSLAKELPYHYYFRQLAHQCVAYDNIEYNLDHFYTYGWHSSTVRPTKRRSEGKKLYQELCILVEEYKQKYEVVKLRLIGGSHGGNVVLHCLPHLPFDRDVIIDVVLLGTPIQESNRAFVNNQHVRRVYSFYSNADWLQCMDIQKWHSDAPKDVPFWSNRTFKYSDDVIQVLLKINSSYIAHSRYRSISRYLPKMLREVDARIADAKRAHIVLDFAV